MSSSSSVCSESTIITQLRAAGCVFAEDEARLLVSAAHTTAEITTMVQARVSGVPLEHLLGWVEFNGMRVTVETGVFVPRRRTEFLVQQAATLLNPMSTPHPVSTRPVVVDLCCGSGAVGTALAATLDHIELHASDIDPVAVGCARRNIATTGTVYEGDLYDPLPTMLRGMVDLLLVNAPYVPTEAVKLMPPEARLHEPQVALDGGADGLDIHRRVAAQALSWLKPGGHLLIETSEPQAPSTVDTVFAHGMAARVASSEEHGATIVIGEKPANP